jgi:ABC-type oligopeptide transport system substrate-binding subunit
MPEIPGDWPDPYNPYPFDEAKAKVDMTKALDDMGIPTDPALLTEKPAEPTADCDAACALYTARVHQIGRLKFGYNCNSGNDQPLFFMYDAWRTILGFAGSQFDISCTDFGTFRTERRAGNVYDLQRNAWGQDFPHPDNQLRDLFATGAGNNNNGYSNPAFDELLNKGAAELDPAKSEAFYHEAQKLVVDDAAVLFLRFYVTRYLVPSHVTGIVGPRATTRTSETSSPRPTRSWSTQLQHAPYQDAQETRAARPSGPGCSYHHHRDGLKESDQWPGSSSAASCGSSRCSSRSRSSRSC